MICQNPWPDQLLKALYKLRQSQQDHQNRTMFKNLVNTVFRLSHWKPKARPQPAPIATNPINTVKTESVCCIYTNLIRYDLKPFKYNFSTPHFLNLKYCFSKHYYRFSISSDCDNIRELCNIYFQLRRREAITPFTQRQKENMNHLETQLVPKFRVFVENAEQYLLVHSKYKMKIVKTLFEVMKACKGQNLLDRYLQIQMIQLVEWSGIKPHFNYSPGFVQVMLTSNYWNYISLHTSKHRLMRLSSTDLKQEWDYIQNYQDEDAIADGVEVRKSAIRRFKAETRASLGKDWKEFLGLQFKRK